MGVVLCPQSDIRWKVFLLLYIVDLSFLRSHRDQLLIGVLMVAQDWDSICTTEDVLFDASVHIVWYWLSFNAQKGK